MEAPRKPPKIVGVLQFLHPGATASHIGVTSHTALIPPAAPTPDPERMAELRRFIEASRERAAGATNRNARRLAQKRRATTRS